MSKDMLDSDMVAKGNRVTTKVSKPGKDMPMKGVKGAKKNV